MAADLVDGHDVEERIGAIMTLLSKLHAHFIALQGVNEAYASKPEEEEGRIVR